MTDELIDRLSADLRPVRSDAMSRLLFGAVVVSALVAAFAMNIWFGMRPDMATAPTTMMFWSKFAYTLGLAALGGGATVVLARPDGRTRWPWLAAIGLIGAVLVAAVIQLSRADPTNVMPLVVGGTAQDCIWRIATLSLPILFASFLALRRFAPRNATLAGLAAGIMSGATGAFVDTFACAEDGMMFLALFYTMAIALVGAIGAALGRLLLKW